jgi:hypothetical protein
MVFFFRAFSAPHACPVCRKDLVGKSPPVPRRATCLKMPRLPLVTVWRRGRIPFVDAKLGVVIVQRRRRVLFVEKKSKKTILSSVRSGLPSRIILK